MIDDLLGGSNKPSKTKIIKQYVIDFKPTSQNDIVKEALALLSKKMDYKKLRAAHAEKLDNLKPKVGRKSKI